MPCRINIMDNKKQEIKQEPKNINAEDKQPQQEKPRQIIIEFTKDSFKIVKAEIASSWEMQALLENLLNQIKPK